MKHAIATGTDVAMVGFFDPTALPADFDECVRAGGYEKIEELGKEGRSWVKNTGADGAYLFHFYVEEEIPERIRKYSIEPQTVARLAVPSGTIWTCGAEYFARDPASQLERFKHMGGKFTVPPGDYTLTAWRTEWPEEMEEFELQKRLGKDFVKHHEILGVCTSLTFLAALIASLTALVKTTSVIGEHWRPGLTWLWGGALAAWALCLPLMRMLNRFEKRPERSEVAMEFPSIVIQMKRSS